MSDQKFAERFRPLAVAELLTKRHHFVIPSFQRGYRWERKQVIDLLDDIFSFSKSDHQNSYFLQPLVVKELGDDRWEVLDGQQRLTTMLLILLRVIADMSPKHVALYEQALYDITYTIRPELDFRNPDPQKTIDGFYLAEAKATIERWFDEKEKAFENMDKFRACLCYPNEEKLVKFIWYVIDPDSTDLNSINVFNRLNKGKIGLTSSELIKALFVLDSELKNGADETDSGQLVMEWNEMERKFQDDRFWYFISNEDRNVQTRIDLLFDFMTQKPEGEDHDYSYRFFQNLFDYCNAAKGHAVRLNPFWSGIGISDLPTAWRQIKATFNSLIAWYEDNLFYHYVGFLVKEGSTPLSIYNDLQQAKTDAVKKNPIKEWTREDSERKLKALIREKFKEEGKYVTRERINTLEYNNSDLVRRVLLLFNIQLCINTGTQRFEFDKFKNERWDIEHVDSQNDSSLQKPEDRILWLRGVQEILQMEHTDGLTAPPLLKECSDLLADFDKKPYGERSFSNDIYYDLYRRVNQYFSYDKAAGDKKFEDVDLASKNKDNINNLTLLNSDINRSYKDAPFPYKRHVIIKEDKAGGHFIPMGTRNLFLKYYSSSNSSASGLNLMRWNGADKDSYLDFIHTIVDSIIDPR